MPAASPKLDLLESLKSDIGIVEEVSDQVIELTPHLALAVAMLYMIASDGEIEDQESSQLQSVLGGDKEVLRYGLAYVKSTSIDEFLQDAPEVLSHKDRLCILANVCDSLLSDGHADDEELVLFYRMVNAMGLNAKAFDPYYTTIAIKNDKTVLGAFHGATDVVQDLGPHHALAIALLYMMTADGAIGSSEIGQLEAVIGEFEGLQKAALKYVRQTKVKQFLDEVTPSLSTAQRLFILTNVCDSMLSDGSVALLENRLFQTILTAFGYDETTFESYYQTIAIKNIKPFDTSEFKPKMTHRRLRGTDKGYQAGADVYNTAANQEVWGDGAGDSNMGAVIQRTMQENIEHVVEDFGSNANVIQVGHNATDELNVQQLAQSLNADNIQRVEDDAGSAANRQTMDLEVDKANRQTLPSALTDVNVQTLSLIPAELNLQTLDATLLTDHHEPLSLEDRMQTLYEDIDGLKERLDRFERESKDFLDAIRAEMLIDVEGVVKEVSPEEQELLNMVDGFLRIDNVQEIPVVKDDENLQQITLAVQSENLQQVPVATTAENVQSVVVADSPDNIQPLARDDSAQNRQTIAPTTAALNYQRIRDAKNLNTVDFNADKKGDVAAGDQAPTSQVELSACNAGEDGMDALTQQTMIQGASFVAGRYAPMGLNWVYAHAKTMLVFVFCVFATPMNMKLPISRITSGFLVTLATDSTRANTVTHDAPLEDHAAQEKITEEVEQTFDLVRLKRD